MPSNQGRDLTAVLKDVPRMDLEDAAAAMWLEVRNHPNPAQCECPAVEVLARLYELGYKVVRS